MAAVSKANRKKKGNARTKQRHLNHISGDRGVDIVRRELPGLWVVRPISPDYGLDLHVEVFEPAVEDPGSGNTLGEHLYVQVKASKTVTLETMTVRSRGNVTKYDPDPKAGDSVDIEVVKFSLDTETLRTVETMGAAVPVLFCYVDLSSEKVYYVCLNDYITKALLPYKDSYEKQDSVTIMIPSWNVLDSTDPSFAYWCLLARRGKYYAAFNTFAYQYHELLCAQFEHPTTQDTVNREMLRLAPEMLTMTRTFLRTALRLDVWKPAGPGFWSPLQEVQECFLFLEKNMPPSDQPLPRDEVERYEHYLLDGFRRAANLGRMYEELVREWRLPTFLAALMDYHPDNKYNPPEIVEGND